MAAEGAAATRRLGGGAPCVISFRLRPAAVFEQEEEEGEEEEEGGEEEGEEEEVAVVPAAGGWQFKLGVSGDGLVAASMTPPRALRR